MNMCCLTSGLSRLAAHCTCPYDSNANPRLRTNTVMAFRGSCRKIHTNSKPSDPIPRIRPIVTMFAIVICSLQPQAAPDLFAFLVAFSHNRSLLSISRAIIQTSAGLGQGASVSAAEPPPRQLPQGSHSLPDLTP